MTNRDFISLCLIIVALFVGSQITAMIYIPVLNNLNDENSRLHTKLLIQRDEINRAMIEINDIQNMQLRCNDIMASLGLIKEKGYGGE